MKTLFKAIAMLLASPYPYEYAKRTLSYYRGSKRSLADVINTEFACMQSCARMVNGGEPEQQIVKLPSYW